MGPVLADYRRITDQWPLLLVVIAVWVMAGLGYLPYLPLTTDSTSAPKSTTSASHMRLAVEWLVTGQSSQIHEAYPAVPEVRHSVVQPVSPAGEQQTNPQIATFAQSLIVAWDQSTPDSMTENLSRRVFAAWSENGIEWNASQILFQTAESSFPLQTGEQTLAVRPFLTVDQRVFAVAAIHEIVGFGTSTATVYGDPEVTEWTEAYPKPVFRVVGYWLREILAERQLGETFRLGNQPDKNRSVIQGAVGNERDADKLLTQLTRQLYRPAGPTDSVLAFPQPEITTADRYRLSRPATIGLDGNQYYRLWSSEQRVDRFFVQISPDAGVTWTAASPSNIPNGGRTAVLGRLSSGPVYLVGNQAGDSSNGTQCLTIALAYENLQFAQCFVVRAIPPPPSRSIGTRPFDRVGELGFSAASACQWQDSVWIAYSVNSEAIHISRIPISVLSPGLQAESE